MGKRRYKEKDVSKPMTEALGIPDLLVLKASTDSHYYAVHKRYFSDDKLPCPACGSTKTRCSKVVKRTFKDILWDKDPVDDDEKGFRVFDLPSIRHTFAAMAATTASFRSLLILVIRVADIPTGCRMRWPTGPSAFLIRRCATIMAYQPRPLQLVPSCAKGFNIVSLCCCQ